MNTKPEGELRVKDRGEQEKKSRSSRWTSANVVLMFPRSSARVWKKP